MAVRSVMLRGGGAFGAALVAVLSFPTAVARLAGSSLVGLVVARRERAAASDPIWSSIQGRRQNSDGLLTFLSDDLTMTDWETQRTIEEQLIPDPWWFPAARKAAGLRPGLFFRRIVWVWQRARRGWSDADLWSLDQSLTTRVAEQLERFADRAHGWPGEGSQWPTFEDWQADLRLQAAKLRAYSRDTDGLYDQFLDARRADDHGAAVAASDALLADEDRRAADAADAFRWIGEHLPHLWD